MPYQTDKQWGEQFENEFEHTETCRLARHEYSTEDCTCELKDIKQFISDLRKADRENFNKDMLKKLKELDIQDSGIEVECGSPRDVPEEVYANLEGFKQGYTVCLNEVKKLFIDIDYLKSL
jgi:hypothetical protein